MFIDAAAAEDFVFIDAQLLQSVLCSWMSSCDPPMK